MATSPKSLRSQSFYETTLEGKKNLEKTFEKKTSEVYFVEGSAMFWRGDFNGSVVYSRLGRFCLRLVLLLTENWLGLRFFQLNFSSVFFPCGGKSVRSFLLTVSPCPEIGLGLFYLWFLHHKQKKRRAISQKTPIVSKKDTSDFNAYFKSQLWRGDL